MLASAISSLDRPNRRVLSILRDWFSGKTRGQRWPIINGKARTILNDEDDLVALHTATEKDTLTRFIQDHWIFEVSLLRILLSTGRRDTGAQIRYANAVKQKKSRESQGNILEMVPDSSRAATFPGWSRPSARFGLRQSSSVPSSVFTISGIQLHASGLYPRGPSCLASLCACSLMRSAPKSLLHPLHLPPCSWCLFRVTWLGRELQVVLPMRN